jgi:N-acetylmuramoyl-L-alanine amidase
VDLRRVAPLFGARIVRSSATGASVAIGDRVFVFLPEERTFTVGGVRVYAGDPLRPHKGSLWMSRVDAARLLGPLVQPSIGLPRAGSVRTICLDPGHGGKDPGTQNRRLGLLEKTFVLDVGLRLAKELEEAGFQVILTRRDDTFVELEERTAIANRAKSDLFISLHFNATQSETVQGTEQFILTPQHQRSTSSTVTAAADRVALAGNRFDLANTTAGFAIHRSIVGMLKRPDRGLRRARFAVLRALNCPGVLVEGAYLSNGAEARLIQDPAFRGRLASVLSGAVRSWSRGSL